MKNQMPPIHPGEILKDEPYDTCYSEERSDEESQ